MIMNTNEKSYNKLSLKEKISYYINNHKFFSGIFLIFTAYAAFQISIVSKNILSAELVYPVFLAIASFFFLIKSFFIGLNTIEESFLKDKWFVMVLGAILLGAQVWLVFFALGFLAVSSYPQEFFRYITVASTLYLILVLISQATKLIQSASIGFVLTTVAYVVLERNVSGDRIFLQVLTFVFLALEVFLTFGTAREYFSK
jgi:hypothetical protein